MEKLKERLVKKCLAFSLECDLIHTMKFIALILLLFSELCLFGVSVLIQLLFDFYCTAIYNDLC